jgi:hypothetical protein
MQMYFSTAHFRVSSQTTTETNAHNEPGTLPLLCLLPDRIETRPFLLACLLACLLAAMSASPGDDANHTREDGGYLAGSSDAEAEDGASSNGCSNSSSRRHRVADNIDADADAGNIDAFLDSHSSASDGLVDATDIAAPTGVGVKRHGATTDDFMEEENPRAIDPHSRSRSRSDYNDETSFYQSADENPSEDEEEGGNGDEAKGDGDGDGPRPCFGSCEGVDLSPLDTVADGNQETRRVELWDHEASKTTASGQKEASNAGVNNPAGTKLEDNEDAEPETAAAGAGVDAGAEYTTAESEYTAESDLSRPDRKIWIVTTAAMPWRTGTAVNPLLRALYLVKNRPKDSVTLLVPWLDDSRDPAAAKAHQAKLYGQVFDKPEDQEAWIRDYCRTRCGCDPKEEALLRIRFWMGVYHDGFGSIFPSEDICALIPDDEADVAILEEPEHLNWFRVPKAVAAEVKLAAARVVETKRALATNQAAASEAGPADPASQQWEQPQERKPNRDEQLGWKAKFRHVVGVLHTNYAAYIRQYGMGTSLLTAPALNALSSLVVRAYCHRVIRLSNCLPSLDAKKEVTENIHGVRSEFLAAATVAAASDVEKKEGAQSSSDVAPVYFIGKLIWVRTLRFFAFLSLFVRLTSHAAVCRTIRPKDSTGSWSCSKRTAKPLARTLPWMCTGAGTTRRPSAAPSLVGTAVASTSCATKATPTLTPPTTKLAWKIRFATIHPAANEPRRFSRAARPSETSWWKLDRILMPT